MPIRFDKVSVSISIVQFMGTSGLYGIIVERQINTYSFGHINQN